MNNHSLFKFITFPIFKTNADLMMIQENLDDQKNSIPFNIRRVLFIDNFAFNVVRGAHTHYKTEQVLIVLRGSLMMEFDNGMGLKETCKIDKSSQGLYIPVLMWHVMKEISKDCLIAVFASTKYDESDYIRDYSEFIKAIKSNN